MAGPAGDPQDPQSWTPWPGWPAPVPSGPPPESGPSARPDTARPLRQADLDRSWQLDFHHPRGVVPLAVRLLDHLVAGSQEAARATGSGHGFTARLVGAHVYFGAPDGAASGDGEAPVDAAALDRYSRGFAREWADDAARIDAQLRRLEAVPVAALARGGIAGLAGYLELALSAHREAWRVHFATMYRLLAVQGYVRGELRALGLDEVTAAGLLQGEENAILAGDHELRMLAAAARRQGLAGLFESPGPGLAERVRSRDEAGRWWTAFEAFLARHGNRGEAGAELTVPAWNEDPESVLALVRRELLEGERPAAASGSAHRQRAGVAEAAETVERVRARLTPQARSRFDVVYRLARRANFAWWNEEHNVLIDLRAHLPVRRAALAASAALGLPRPDDALYLHVEELAAVFAGDAGRLEPAGTADQRRTYVEQWRARRPDLPVQLGSDGDGRDPVLQEILGAGSGGGSGARSGGGSGGGVALTGLGVSRGRARGPARVLAGVIDLADVRAGEVMICEATSPAWTSAFDRIAGCVCEQGGMLTHAAIIAREYGVPAVCAVAGACTAIATGDLVEVDGTTGKVRVLRPAPTRSAREIPR